MSGRVLLLAALLPLTTFAGDYETMLAETKEPLDRIALRYLVLELAMGEIDVHHVDAYFGPEVLREAAQAAGWDSAAIIERAKTLDSELVALKRQGGEANPPARIKGLRERLLALRTRAGMSAGASYSFDEESLALFGAVAPRHDAAHFQAIIDEIDALLPGEGAVAERVQAFRARFEIPPERLGAVFEAAVEACRERTATHIELPPDESFIVEYVTDQPWTGYNWYQGDAHSLIQVNTDLPIRIDRALGLGCHEGYPGHHVYNALLERSLVQEKGWIEYSLYPLYSPQSLIAEGSANYGIDLAFDRDDRVAFEQAVLFPLAGLEPAEADRYYALLDLTGRLSHAGNTAARAFLDGEISREEAVAWLQRYALMSPAEAEKRVDFMGRYRSYVINYNLGKDLVAAWVEAGGTDDATRWRRFTELLSSPISAADIGGTSAQDR